MKHLFIYFILNIIVLSSCTRDGVLNESFPINQNSEFKLISKKEIKESNKLYLKAEFYKPAYESSIPIYRYLFYSSSTTDHLYTTEKSQNLKHDGMNYTLEQQQFNFMPQKSIDVDMLPIYRHYSVSKKDHMFSTSNTESTYTNEGLLGYIFVEQQIGTVPLKEYYSSKVNNHLYAVKNTEIEDWLPVHATDFKYQKTLGYVYTGQAVDEKKMPTEFIINNPNESLSFDHFSITLNVKVRENDRYFELKYSAENIRKGQSVSLPINNTYTVVSADMELIVPNWDKATIDNITNPEQSHFGYGWSGYSLFIEIKRNITGYIAKYDIRYNIATGS